MFSKGLYIINTIISCIKLYPSPEVLNPIELAIEPRVE